MSIFYSLVCYLLVSVSNLVFSELRISQTVSWSASGNKTHLKTDIWINGNFLMTQVSGSTCDLGLLSSINRTS